MGESLEPRRALTDAWGGLAVTVVLMLAVALAGSRFLIAEPSTVTLLGYLAVWVPLITAVVVACLRHGSGSFRSDFRLLVRPIDLLWGLSIGLLARVIAGLTEILAYGDLVPPPLRFLTSYDIWWVFTALLAPVLIGPIVEELFFRGLLLRAVLLRYGSPALAIVLSGVVFAIVHLAKQPLGAGTIVIGVSTLVLGLAVAALAVVTGRIGGAVIAHITFNALVVVPALF